MFCLMKGYKMFNVTILCGNINIGTATWNFLPKIGEGISILKKVYRVINVVYIFDQAGTSNGVEVVIDVK